MADIFDAFYGLPRMHLLWETMMEILHWIDGGNKVLLSDIVYREKNIYNIQRTFDGAAGPQ